MEEEVKKIIEENAIAFSTIDKKGEPYTIAVAYVKVKDNKIIITNNYMKTTVENIKRNPYICIAAWDKKWTGYQIKGFAKYFKGGKWMSFIQKIPENKDEPCKGVVVIEIENIKKLG